MKTLTVLLTLMMSAAVFAETDHNIRVNRIDMSEAAPDETGDTKATDHNSSRSNKTSHTPATKVEEDGDSDDAESSGNKATDYNSSRSNKADGAAADEENDEDKPAEELEKR